MSTPETTSYFRDLYEIGIDRSLSLEEKIERAITIGRDRLDVPYGVLSYTGSGDYEIIDSTFTDGDYVAGSVHDLDTTWCRHVVGDQQVLAISDAAHSAYSDDVARNATNLQCYIGGPILVDGESYGTLCYSGEEPRSSDFTEDEKTVRAAVEPVDQLRAGTGETLRDPRPTERTAQRVRRGAHTRPAQSADCGPWLHRTRLGTGLGSRSGLP
ncbi:GAF domain-containing protein [Halobellus ordinarius]|uniref:GAF domain-containing protein n=1 Tax=Halobellus ordinarius TaxID=3075120 RepID=UPI00288093E4|nr:GAF domain-containing protein [Halobellus sp. ZY16]